MVDIFNLTAQFNDEICGVPRPSKPTKLEGDRLDWFIGAANEELQELINAGTIEDQADAILDLMYFAGGRLYEMGINSAACLEAIHTANMLKQRGELAKRPGSKGHDAVKPAGWKSPDLRAAMSRPSMYNNPRIWPRILVIGHGRHGKDTVAAMLHLKYNMRFTSSSRFCAERVMMPYFEQSDTVYMTADECFHDRHNHRASWYHAIREFNRPDATTLARAILENNDVYCGMRSKAELFACRNAGIFDHVIWVDRSEHVPAEGALSCSVEPWMADYIIDNNGTLEDLEFNVGQLMARLLA